MHFGISKSDIVSNTRSGVYRIREETSVARGNDRRTRQLLIYGVVRPTNRHVVGRAITQTFGSNIAGSHENTGCEHNYNYLM